MGADVLQGDRLNAVELAIPKGRQVAADESALRRQRRSRARPES
jgi:hypothetical protein